MPGAAPRLLLGPMFPNPQAPLVAVLFSIVSCSSSPEAVVTSRAATELACAPRDVQASCHGGKVFHLAEQFHCEARGCGQVANYRCEAPLRSVGPFDVHLAASCQ